MKAKANDLFIKITMAFIFPMLIIALVISLTGFRGPIQLDNTYYNFIQRASIEANSWNIEIPSIPHIDYGSNVNEGFDILKILSDIGNFFINVLNVIIMLINLVISLFTTIGAIIKLLLTFKDYDFSNSGGLSYWNCIVTA